MTRHGLATHERVENKVGFPRDGGISCERLSERRRPAETVHVLPRHLSRPLQSFIGSRENFISPAKINFLIDIPELKKNKNKIADIPKSRLCEIE